MPFFPVHHDDLSVPCGLKRQLVLWIKTCDLRNLALNFAARVIHIQRKWKRNFAWHLRCTLNENLKERLDVAYLAGSYWHHWLINKSPDSTPTGHKLTRKCESKSSRVTFPTPPLSLIMGCSHVWKSNGGSQWTEKFFVSMGNQTPVYHIRNKCHNC